MALKQWVYGENVGHDDLNGNFLQAANTPSNLAGVLASLPIASPPSGVAWLNGGFLCLGSGVAPGKFGITLDFSAGLTVVAGTYRVVGTATFPFTIDSLDYEVGDAGGSFTAAVQISGAPVTGLSAISVSSSMLNAVATGGNSVITGNRVSIIISAVSGSPANAVLTLRCTR